LIPIPQELRSQRRWLTWAHRDGRKPPVNAAGFPDPEWNDPETWLTYDAAVQRFESAEGIDGVGFVLGDGFSCIDMDHCRLEDGTLCVAAENLLAALPTAYAEVSPSGEGVKVFCRGEGWAELNYADPAHVRAELKPSGYMTVTGEALSPERTALPLLRLEGLVSRFAPGAVADPAAPKVSPPLPAVVVAGGQEQAMFREGCRLRRMGWQEREIATALWGLVQSGRFPSEPGREPWSQEDCAEKARSAARYKPDEASASLETVITLAEPLSTARLFVGTYAPEGLVHQADIFYRWDRAANAWLPTDAAEVRAAGWRFLEGCVQRKKDEKTGDWTVTKVKPTPRVVNDVMDAARAVCVFPRDRSAPCWYDGREAEGMVAFRNGLLRLSDRVLLPKDPEYFNLVALPFDYVPDAPEPVEWLKFVSSLWPEDVGESALLQEVLGYLVSGETSFQKILMMVGPKRGGKGTIARVVQKLLGRRNVCGPTLATLGETFGREPLIGKSVAIIADARLSRKTDTAAVVEELLAISGEDSRSVARKFLPAWEGQLRVRFLLLTNELPRVEDASGALASRFVILRLTQSFYGREDRTLFNRLVPELPGILNWALEGWVRVQERGHFSEPESSAEIIAEFESLGSPITAFLKEHAIVGPQRRAPRDETWGRWKDWCEATGRNYAGTKETLGRDLRAAIPGMGEVRTKDDQGRRSRVWTGFELVPYRAPGEDDVPF
jgi:putative DNA primase/helicase